MSRPCLRKKTTSFTQREITEGLSLSRNNKARQILSNAQSGTQKQSDRDFDETTDRKQPKQQISRSPFSSYVGRRVRICMRPAIDTHTHGSRQLQFFLSSPVICDVIFSVWGKKNKHTHPSVVCSRESSSTNSARERAETSPLEKGSINNTTHGQV
jgi:hypothetical protein